MQKFIVLPPADKPDQLSHRVDTEGPNVVVELETTTGRIQLVLPLSTSQWIGIPLASALQRAVLHRP